MAGAGNNRRRRNGAGPSGPRCGRQDLNLHRQRLAASVAGLGFRRCRIASVSQLSSRRSPVELRPHMRTRGFCPGRALAVCQPAIALLFFAGTGRTGSFCAQTAARPLLLRTCGAAFLAGRGGSCAARVCQRCAHPPLGRRKEVKRHADLPPGQGVRGRVEMSKSPCHVTRAGLEPAMGMWPAAFPRAAPPRLIRTAPQCLHPRRGRLYRIIVPRQGVCQLQRFACAFVLWCAVPVRLLPVCSTCKPCSARCRRGSSGKRSGTYMRIV